MRLTELFVFEQDTELLALINKIKAAKAELNQIKQQGAFVGSGVVSPQYKERYLRAKQRLEVATQDLERYNKAKGAEATQRAFYKDRAAAQSSETSDMRKARFGAAVGAGLDNTNALRKEYGGWKGLAQRVYDIAVAGSEYGKYKITCEYIADKLGTTPRTVARWLERIEFARTRQLMGL